MEFDNKIRLGNPLTIEINSPLGYVEMHAKVWDIFLHEAKSVGDAGEGEFWLDYSDGFRTRHIVVNMEETEPNKYTFQIRSGKKSGFWGDISLMVLALVAFWGLSKAFVPEPPVYSLICLIGAAGIAGYLLHFLNKDFGKEESNKMLNKIKELDYE